MNTANRVVYVDDDREDRELLEESFSDAHHHLISLKNGAELFDYLAAHHQQVCLVVLDINIPGKDGLQLFRELRVSPYAHLPVILFSTGVNSPQAKEIKTMGVEVIEKPSTYRDLETITQKLLSFCLHHQATSLTK